MAKRELAWELIGDGCWIDANPNRWAIANWNWEEGTNTEYTDEPWTAIYSTGSTSSYYHFTTHEAATDFVRSEIDSLRTSD